MNTSRQHLDSFICRDLVLDSFSLDTTQSIKFRVSLYSLARYFSLIFSYLSRQFLTIHLPKHFSLSLNLLPNGSSAQIDLPISSMILFSLFFMHFIHIDLGFGDFRKILGFFKIDEVFANFWVGFCLNDPICSCIASHLHFHNISCIIDVSLLC